MAVSGGNLSRLSRRHSIKVSAGLTHTVEELALVAGEVIGHGYIKSAAQINGEVVLFVEKVARLGGLGRNAPSWNCSLRL